MKKSKKRALNIFVLAAFMMNIFMGSFSFKANALEDCIKASKSVNKSIAKPEEEIEVSLNVKGTPPINSIMPNDVILIVDKSGSMGGQKIFDAKESAKNFVDLMDLTKHRVGIVDYSFTENISSLPLTTNKDEAKGYIDSIVSGGQTHTGNAIRKAKELLQNHRTDAQPVIIIMTDGAANFGGSEATGFADAKAAATEAKDAGIIFYTIALLEAYDNPDTSPQNIILKEMATTAQHHSFVLGSIGLNEIYKRIVKEIGIASAYDVTIKEVVSPEFEIVPDSYNNNIPKPTVNGNTISWHLLEIKDQELKFNYKIRAKKDAKLGKQPIVTESKITYKDFAGSQRTLNIISPEVSIEYPAPTITEVTPNKGLTTGGNEITIKGTNFREGAKVYFDGDLATNVKVISGNEIKATAPAAFQKTAILKVVNTDTKYATSSYLYWAKPVVTTLTPNKGPVTGNTVVTIRGENFLNGINVKFGDKLAKKVIYKNPTLIYAVTDVVETPATVDVTLTNPDTPESEIVINGGFTFEGQKDPAPTIKALNPAEGYINEAKTVTIDGTNFKAGAKVRFGDKEATNVIVNSVNALTVTVPTVDKEQVVDVVVINSDTQEGKLEKAYTYKLKPEKPAPVISSIVPNSCYINETKAIVINGQNFQNGAKVYIGAVEATEVDSTHFNYITAKVPASDKAQTVDVKIVNPDGKEVLFEKGFTYKDTPGPEITEISPKEAFVKESKYVNITGNNFKSGIKVKFNNKEVETTYYNEHYIQVKCPIETTPMEVDVILTNLDGKEVKAEKAFAYKPEPEKLAPVIAGIAPNSCYINETKTITINGQNFQLGAKVYVGAVEATEVDSTRSTYITAKVPVSDKALAVDVKVVNPDGKEVILSKGFTYMDTPGPTIKEVSPNKTIVNTSKVVGIYGQNFQKGLTVKVDGVEVTGVYYGSSTSITFTMPIRTTPGAVDITITNPDGKVANIEKGFTYEAEPEKPAPVITEISPNKTIVNTSKIVAIYGQNFQKGLTVKVDGVEVTGVYYGSSTSITFTMPMRTTPGAVDITITNPDGKEVRAEKGFTYEAEPEKPAPVITEISPNKTIINTSKIVAIYGQNFQKGLTVKVDGVEVIGAYCSNSTCVTFTMPMRATPGAVDITITNPDGKEVRAEKGFTYELEPEKPAPTIKEVSPNKGLINTRNRVTIYGGNFQKGLDVRIDGIQATDIYFSSSTCISFTTPMKSTAGAVEVKIINPDGKEVVLSQGYTYTVPEMNISYLSPNHGKMEGGYYVGVYGINFASDSEIYVNGTRVFDIQYRSSGLIEIIKMPASLKEGQVDIEVRSASLGQTKVIKFTYDPKPVVPAPEIRTYSSYLISGQSYLDVYAYYLSKNMVLRIVDTGEEITNTATYSTYVSFKLPLSYRGKTIKAILVNKDENKESTPFEFIIK